METFGFCPYLTYTRPPPLKFRSIPKYLSMCFFHYTTRVVLFPTYHNMW